MRTRAEVVYRVLKFMNRMPSVGQAVPAEDYDAVDKEIPGVIEMLRRRGITYVSDISQIEDAAFLPLCRIIVATASCADFGVPLSEMSGFQNEPRNSELELRAMSRDVPTNDRIRFDNF